MGPTGMGLETSSLPPTGNGTGLYVDKNTKKVYEGTATGYNLLGLLT
jgi:hypothetical protein